MPSNRIRRAAGSGVTVLALAGAVLLSGPSAAVAAEATARLLDRTEAWAAAGVASIPVPSPPSAQAMAAQAWVSWEPVVSTDDPLTGYTVHVYDGGVEVASWPAAANMTGRLIPQLTPGTDYAFALSVSTADGEGAPSPMSVVVTPFAAEAANLVTDVVGVPGYPSDIVISPDGSRLYAINNSGHAVVVLDTATNAVLATVPLDGFLPLSIAISPDGRTVYASGYLGAQFRTFVVDTATNTVAATIPGRSIAWDAVVSPDGSRLYLANNAAETVTVVDTATNTVVGELLVTGRPYRLAVAADGSALYVALVAADELAVVDPETGTVSAAIPLGSRPLGGIAVALDGGVAYTRGNAPSVVTVVDLAAGAELDSIPVGEGASAIAVASDGSTVYTADGVDGTVSVIDAATRTVLADIATNNPTSVGVAPDGSAVFVANFQDGTVSVLRHVTTPVTVAFDANGGTGAMAPRIRSMGQTAVLPVNAFVAPPGLAFAGWNTEVDGSGTAYPDSAEYGFGADLTLYAQWIDPVVAELEVHGPVTAVEGDAVSYTVEGFNAVGVSLGDVTSQTTLSSDQPADSVLGHEVSFGFDPAALGGATTRTLTAALVSDPAVTAALAVSVSSSAVALRLDAPTYAVQGDTITVAVEALDVDGVLLGDASSAVVLSSSVAEDEIVGNRVRFLHASPHTLTATVPSAPTLTASITVEVAPALLTLPAAGADSVGPFGTGLVLLLLGGAAVLLAGAWPAGSRGSRGRRRLEPPAADVRR